MATIYHLARSIPVKLRDLSTRGGLIEGVAIPPLDARIRLCRGSLEVAGEIVWSTQGRAGLRFDSDISVNDWLPQSLRRDHQQSTDEAVQRAKAMRFASLPEATPLGPGRIAGMSPNNLYELRAALQSLSEDLAADPHVVQHHIAKLQTLDLVAQALTSIADEKDLVASTD